MPPKPSRIRSDYPPKEYRKHKERHETITFCSLSAIVVAIFYSIFYLAHYGFLGDAQWLFIILWCAAALIILKIQKPKPNLPSLHSYNTEFITPLADHTHLVITVFFQIPAIFPHDPNNPDIPLQKTYDDNRQQVIDQLNRVTENLIIPFCYKRTTPPTPLEVQNYLHLNLVDFQNEYCISVLRVNVPIILHKTPDKPQGVNV